MIHLLRRAVFLLWTPGVLGIQSGGDATTTAAATTADRASLLSTCPNRTINFITQTLAQQCLKSDRRPQESVPSSTSIGNDSASPTSGSTSSDVTIITLTQTIRPTAGTVTLEVPISHDDNRASADVTSSSTASTQEEPATPTLAEAEDDSESPLDNANFLSFEEWKKQNLAKVGQSPDDIGRGQPIDTNRPRPGINNALDTLGEDQEINLDFAGFGSGPQIPVVDSQISRGVARSSAVPSAGGQDLEASSLRSKDAGKTCKERSNYASFDCAATILKSNKECKSASSVLVENKDSYMLNTCSATNKFFIVQLCDDIQIDTIVLANYEFFSSSFRDFRISVSDRYPVKMEKWKDLGTFEARNTREIQAFLVQNPLIWARYLRIEFLSHYGTEYYCPVSVLRVHGTTMWEDYRHQEEIARGEEEEATLEIEALATPPVVPAPVVVAGDAASAVPHVTLDEKVTASASAADVESVSGTTAVSSLAVSETSSAPVQTAVDEGGHETAVTASSSDAEVTSMADVTQSETTATSTESLPTTELQESSDKASNAPNTSTTDAMESGAVSNDATASGAEKAAITSTPSIASSSVADSSAVEINSTQAHNTSETTVLPSDGNSPTMNATAAVVASQNATSTNATRAIVSTTVPQPPQPSTQESFFKSFHKRLQQLESNSTWSLQYIEEQSRILRDAFTKVEKRQLATTSKFLSQLNSTVMAELRGFGQSYDQLWQSTVIELDGQREAYQREMLAMSTRLTMVADELVWQKRMGIVQSTLLLLCLALAIFTRSENGFLEVPLMQQMMNKSNAAFRGDWESPPNSPSPDSRSPVSLFRRKLWRSSLDPERSASDTEMSRPQSRDQPDITIEAPSPNAGHTQADYFDEQDEIGGPPNREPGQDKRESPKKQRKKAKKLQGGFPHSNGKAKSPLAL